MNRFGFVRVSSVCPSTAIADPEANAGAIIAALDVLRESDIVVFPELALTGYTCGDLFGQPALLDAALRGLERIAAATAGRPGLVAVGLPLGVESSLYNGAAVLHDGGILGIVPKQFLPNYKEFYEARWFRAGDGREPDHVTIGNQRVPFGIDLLFEGPAGVVVGVEICEDLWVQVPPSAIQALAGATILLNLSASNETIGKREYRSNLVLSQSGRCVAAYAFASCGPSESTTDLVFGGHLMIAENGRMLADSRRVGAPGTPFRAEGSITADVDVEKLLSDRRVTSSFDDDTRHRRAFRRIAFGLASTMPGLQRFVPGAPFVPAEDAELHHRCAEIFGIQCAGLAKRLGRLPADATLHIGISGGLDSTLGLLVAVKTCDLLGHDRKRVHGLTMPGFGTTRRTLANALALMEQLGISADTIDIRALALQSFKELKHRPFGIDTAELDVPGFMAALARVPNEHLNDLVFENVQARLRTFLLMSRGFVVGTGDLSELALGWCTYNGDHMSMYNPNCSIPKTLVRFLVRYAAENEFSDSEVRATLLSIAATLISPELLPASATGEIEQSTEATLGPYELHDFFLYHMIRCGYPPAKLLFLASHARFSRSYSPAVIEQTLRVFCQRFFSQQFKRSCVPDGPKVGSVSLSPRGDWRMPSDADAAAWLDTLS